MWSLVSTLRELYYAKFLETDVEYGEFNDFVEGLFNKWDLKTHPNMKSNLQQSKLRLSNIQLSEISCNSLDLMELRSKKQWQAKSIS
ncbi:hypothetical protein C2G38_2202147 [Gigaspora rosea]|uniref:Uncharacterized protein n=1 Tax=Gigaspora rosea TaxID=44941 RepID=A0A397UT77_9GLOM|nr:hypothetical protein C2G38_2202147 [Gigaspora rosea]